MHALFIYMTVGTACVVYILRIVHKRSILGFLYVSAVNIKDRACLM